MKHYGDVTKICGNEVEPVGLCDLYLNKTYVPKGTNADGVSGEADNGVLPSENE